MLELRKDARIFAIQNGIDLSAAYSVLLGVMTLGQVQDVTPSGGGNAKQRRFASATALDAKAAPATDAGALLRPRPSDAMLDSSLDPAFLPAIESGQLSHRQAMERGSREVYIRKLIERHKLTRELACAVADNRLSLLVAIRRRRETERRSQSAIALHATNSVPQRTKRPVLIAIAIGAIAAAAGFSWWSFESRLEMQEETVSVETDDQGRIVQVAGPDPRAVLKAYCDARQTRQPLQSLGLMPTPVESSRLRVGLLRDPSNSDVLLSIAIRRDPSRERWSAGDGRAPLIAIRAPQGAEVAGIQDRSRERMEGL